MRQSPGLPTRSFTSPLRYAGTPRALAVAAALLAILSGCATTLPATALPQRPAPVVHVSTAPDGADAIALAGRTVSGELYVFLTDDEDLRTVRLWVAGERLVPGSASPAAVPFARGFAARAKPANHPWNTKGLPNGHAKLVVEAEPADGGEPIVDEVEFEIDNSPADGDEDAAADTGSGKGADGDATDESAPEPADGDEDAAADTGSGEGADGDEADESAPEPADGDEDAPAPDSTTEPTQPDEDDVADESVEAPDPDSASPDRLLFGAWTAGGPWHGMEDTYFDLERRIDARLDIVHWYMSFSTRWMGELVRSTSTDGRIPMITWEAYDESLDDIAAGVYDERLRDWGRGAAAYGRPLYLRPFQEMNADFFPWGMDPERFVAAWRHIVDVFREEGAHNVRFVWSPNADDNPATAQNKMEHYYPGGAYVDVLAVDGYNWGTCTEWGAWRSFEDVMADAYGRVAALGDQPIWIAEFGSTELGGDKAAWIRNALSSTAFPRLEALVYFDEDTGHGCDWNLDTSKASMDALAESLDAWGATSYLRAAR